MGNRLSVNVIRRLSAIELSQYIAVSTANPPARAVQNARSIGEWKTLDSRHDDGQRERLGRHSGMSPLVRRGE